jgi:hypothetical protein
LKAWPLLRIRCSGVAPKQSFVEFHRNQPGRTERKVRDRENALASTRDACATQTRDYIPL